MTEAYVQAKPLTQNSECLGAVVRVEYLVETKLLTGRRQNPILHRD